MNYRKFTFSVIMLILMSYVLTGQTVHFSYDDSGNRTGRTLEVMELQAGSIQFPLTNDLALKEITGSGSKGSGVESKEDVKNEQDKELVQDDTNTKVKIYPNPTRGILKIELLNFYEVRETELRLYDLNGSEKIIDKGFTGLKEVDISHLPDGIYVLKIRANDKIFDFKVIKRY